MAFDSNQLQKCVALAFEAAKLLKLNGFSGQVDAKDLLAPILYKELEEAKQLGAFGNCVRTKIEIDGSSWPISTMKNTNESNRRAYEIH